jgi:hypothetical protein
MHLSSGKLHAGLMKIILHAGLMKIIQICPLNINHSNATTDTSLPRYPLCA